MREVTVHDNEVRQEIVRLLRSARRPTRQRALEVSTAVAGYLSAHGPSSEMEAREIMAIAVDAQLESGWSKVVVDALGALSWAAEEMSLETKEARQSVVTIALCACMLIDRLTQRGRVNAQEQVAAWFSVNQADDRLLRGYGRYPMRATLVALARNGLVKVEDHVRHTDLVARFKLAIEYAASNDDVMLLEAVEHMRALIPAIESRIAETVDAPGPGARPDGAPVAPLRVAEREIEAGPVVFAERYRSLPRLRAQALFELGRILTSTGLLSIDLALEEAFSAFEKASIAFTALSDARWSAHCAVAAAQCLGWLADRLRGDDAERHAQRLFEYGVAAHKQVLSARLPKEQERALALLAKSSYQRTAWWRQIGAVQGPVDETIKLQYRDVVVWLMQLEQLATTDPWVALTCGTVAIEHMHAFLAWGDSLSPPPADDEERAAREAATRETLRHYVPPKVVDALVTAMRGALETPLPERPLDPPGAPAPDVWTPRTLPGAFSLRLHTALLTLLRAGAIQPSGLTEAQWDVVARVASGVRPMAMSTELILSVRRLEGLAIEASATALGTVPLADLVERRLAAIERHLANPVLSVAERLLLSGWISGLVLRARGLTDDLASLPPRRALALIERAGASAYRSDAFIFGRFVPELPSAYGPIDSVRFADGPMPDPAVEAWAHVHLARNHLDFWSRAKMVREAARVNPTIAMVFEPVLADPPLEIIAFPSDVPLEAIQHATGAEVDECEVTADHTVVRLQPRNLAQIDRHIDPVRRFLIEGLRRLTVLHEVAQADFTGCPAADPAVIERWLADHPSTALLIPGWWPEEATALNVFTAHDGALRRARIDVGDDEARGQRVVAVLEFADSLGADASSGDRDSWERLVKALDQVAVAYAPWSKAVATHLRALDIRRVVFLLRGPNTAQVPWEMFATDDEGTRFGDSFETTWLYTLAELPRPTALRERSGVVQIVGGGSSEAQLAAGAGAMRALADVGLAHPPVGGAELCEAGRLSGLLGRASRARLFLHGHHSPLYPEGDRLTLVDAGTPRERVNLSPRDLRRLPWVGMDCVELWACEGAAHGRQIQEHGLSDDPEDLTAAILLAGARRVVASRWHVPTLPSALLLELYALHLGRGHGDAAALAAAGRVYRQAFAADGPVERALLAALTKDLEQLVAGPYRLQREELEAATVRAYHAAVGEQRAIWYRDAGRAAPRDPLDDKIVVDSMAKAMPPRSQRIASSLGQGSDVEIRPLVDEILAVFRTPAAWCGWRVTARDLSAV